MKAITRRGEYCLHATFKEYEMDPSKQWHSQTWASSHFALPSESAAQSNKGVS